MTIQYANPSSVDAVRLLIADTDTDNQVLTDDQIKGFLVIETGSVKRAAAQALEAIAVSEALVSKVIRTQDLQTDGSKVATALMARATALRTQAEDDEDHEAGWQVIDFRNPPLTSREGVELAAWGWL